MAAILPNQKSKAKGWKPASSRSPSAHATWPLRCLFCLSRSSTKSSYLGTHAMLDKPQLSGATIQGRHVGLRWDSRSRQVVGLITVGGYALV